MCGDQPLELGEPLFDQHYLALGIWFVILRQNQESSIRCDVDVPRNVCLREIRRKFQDDLR